MHRARHSPPDNATRKDIDDERHVGEPAHVAT
jgi:hypothetical protein